MPSPTLPRSALYGDTQLGAANDLRIYPRHVDQALNFSQQAGGPHKVSTEHLPPFNGCSAKIDPILKEGEVGGKMASEVAVDVCGRATRVILSPKGDPFDSIDVSMPGGIAANM